MAICKSCFRSVDVQELISGNCKNCRGVNTEKTRDEILKDVPENEFKKIIITTESNSPFEIENRLGIITAECVLGLNIFKDMFAGIRDMVGGRNKSSQDALKEAKNYVLEELKREAYVLGANAVIAIDLDYSEFTGAGKSMLFVVASGTAVKAINPK